MFLFKKSFSFFAKPGQINFQEPCSQVFENLIALHNYIMFFIIMILFFVFTILFLTLLLFTVPEKINNIESIKKILNIYNIKINHDTKIEIIWTLVPSLILFLIAIPSFSILYSFEIFHDSSYNLKIIGHQWYWSYEFTWFSKIKYFFMGERYSYKWNYFNKSIDHGIRNGLELTFIKLPAIWTKQSKICYFNKIAFDSYMLDSKDLLPGQLRLLHTTNPLILPVFTNIKTFVTSSDVIHSWAIPSLGIKMDALPGRLNEIYLFINKEGISYGQCSELCGVNHGFMPITIYSVNPLIFEYVLFFFNKKLINMDILHFFFSMKMPLYNKLSGDLTDNWFRINNFYLIKDKKNYTDFLLLDKKNPIDIDTLFDTFHFIAPYKFDFISYSIILQDVYQKRIEDILQYFLKVFEFVLYDFNNSNFFYCLLKKYFFLLLLSINK